MALKGLFVFLKRDRIVKKALVLDLEIRLGGVLAVLVQVL